MPLDPNFLRSLVDPNAGPGLTAQSFAGALGPDDVTAGASPVPQYTPAPDLLSHYQSLGAGIQQQPQQSQQQPTTAPPPEHHSLLTRIVHGLGHGLQVGIDRYADALAPIPDALRSQLSPTDIQQIRRSALFNDGLATLNRQPDRNGFMPSTLESLSRGAMAGQDAGSRALSNIVSSQQYAAKQAATSTLAAKRAQLQSQFQILPTDSPADVDGKVQQLAAGYAQIGDTQSLAALGQASSLFRQPKPAAPPKEANLGKLENVIDPSTGKPATAFYDQATGKIVSYNAQVMKANPADRAMSAEQEDKTIDRITKTYDHEIDDVRKARSGYEVLEGALANPSGTSTYAMLDALSRVVNPGAIVRPTTLEILQATGSAPDRIRRWASMLDKGMWPPDLTAQVQRTIGGIMQAHIDRTATPARQRALARLRKAGIADPETYLDDVSIGSAAPRGTAPSTGTTANPY